MLRFHLLKFLFSPRIRIAGIRGIQGVVRKTVNDELRATIWEPQHMDKIVPSLLFNMQKIEDIDRYYALIIANSDFFKERFRLSSKSR